MSYLDKVTSAFEARAEWCERIFNFGQHLREDLRLDEAGSFHFAQLLSQHFLRDEWRSLGWRGISVLPALRRLAFRSSAAELLDQKRRLRDSVPS